MRINWKKSLLVTVDIVLAVYLLCAFTVFNKPDETARVCTKAKIVVADESSNGFINANEITKRLKSAGLYPLGKLMRDINAREIEEKLKKSPFVKTAQCYKTEDGEVNVSITQLLPVIRVKADNGDDYYLDDKDCIMPNSLYRVGSHAVTSRPWARPSWATTCGRTSWCRSTFCPTAA